MNLNTAIGDFMHSLYKNGMDVDQVAAELGVDLAGWDGKTVQKPTYVIEAYAKKQYDFSVFGAPQYAEIEQQYMGYVQQINSIRETMKAQYLR